MTLTLDLSPELEVLLRDEAARRGLSVQEYALRALATGVQTEAAGPGTNDRPTNGAEALAYWQREGVLGLFADRPDTPEFARELRRQAETRVVTLNIRHFQAVPGLQIVRPYRR